MMASQARSPVVIDSDVFGSLLVPGSKLAAIYEPIILGRPAFISFQTAAELHYGVLHQNRSTDRMLKLQARIRQAETVHSGPELTLVYVHLRAACERIGHALGEREHDAHRWIAATAIRLGIPLVSNDEVFKGVPSLALETAGI